MSIEGLRVEEKRGVKILLPDEAKTLKDIQGRELDKYHDIDGCNEYKKWSTERRKGWW